MKIRLPPVVSMEQLDNAIREAVSKDHHGLSDIASEAMVEQTWDMIWGFRFEFDTATKTVTVVPK